MSIRGKLLSKMNHIKVYVTANHLQMEEQEAEEFYRLTITLENIWAAVKQPGVFQPYKQYKLTIAYKATRDYYARRRITA